MKDMRLKDSKGTLALKFAVVAIYIWSCFFWAGVTILNFYINDKEYSYLATGFLVGSLIIAVSIILMFFRLYIIQFPFCAVGTGIFLKNAGEMIDVADKTGVVFEPSFGARYMPCLIIAMISLVFLILQTARLILDRRADKEKFYNSPTKSILDD